MKAILNSSVFLVIVLLAGCERSPQSASSKDGAGTNQALQLEPGTVAGGSEDWGYLGLKILRAHEKQVELERPPWHAPGGDWTFLECEVATAQVLIGTRVGASTKAEIPITWGEAVLAVSDPGAGSAFIEMFSKAFHQPAPARHGDKPPGFLKVHTAVLGEKQVRDPKGGFKDGRRGTWTATKWFLQNDDAEAEVFFNYSLADKRAEFSEKDPDYREELLEQLVVGLRDGPLPERTPENDRSLTLEGPRVVGWSRITETNETAQFAPAGDSLAITALVPGGGPAYSWRQPANPQSDAFSPASKAHCAFMTSWRARKA